MVSMVVVSGGRMPTGEKFLQVFSRPLRSLNER
jgi:hypothetical protein